MSNIADGLVSAILFCVLAIGLVIAYQVFSILPDFGQTAIKTSGEGFFTALDAMGIFIVVAMILATVGSAFLIRTNPMFFAVSLILLAVQFLILPMVVNALNPVFQGMPAGEAKFANMIWLVQIAPIISFVGGALAAIIALRGE